ncbi:hypothetical protein LguiB_018483 [Lonicera macranthoides]
MNTYPKTLKSFSIWGDPIPKLLTKKADEYIPKDFEEFIYMVEIKPYPCLLSLSDIFLIN